MSNAGRICPQCSYERQARDLAPDYECPRCGIIYNKYVPPKPSAPVAENGTGEKRPPAPVTGHDKPMKDGAAATPPFGVAPAKGLVPASLARRAQAAIFTGSKALYYIVLLAVPFYYGYQFFCFVAQKNFSSHVVTALICYEITLIILLGKIFLLNPIQYSETPGQKAFGLTVLRVDNPRGELTWTHWLLRYLGDGAAVCVFPITLAGFFYGLLTRKNFPSIADRLSKTRQYEMEKPLIRLSHPVWKAFKPLVIAVLIFSGVLVIPNTLWEAYLAKVETRRITAVTSPEEREKQKAFRNELKNKVAQRAEAAADQNTFQILSELEHRHYSDQGGYTDDLEALVSRYATANSNTTATLLVGIRDGSIRARKTTEGVEIWTQTASGDWQSKELRR